MREGIQVPDDFDFESDLFNDNDIFSGEGLGTTTPQPRPGEGFNSDFDIDGGAELDIGVDDVGDTSSDDFELANSEAEQNKREIKKIGLQAILTGVGVVILAFIIVAVINGVIKLVKGSKEPAPPPTTAVTQPVTNNPGTSTTSPNSRLSDWKAFSAADGLSFNEEYVTTAFTVTSIEHYLKVVDSEKNVQVQTRLTGALAGYIGTYELTVPYSKGSLLSPGVHFDVSVQIGSTKEGKIVVGDIQY